MRIHTLQLILFRAYAELVAESTRYMLGIIWWIVEPILYMASFYFLFALVLQRGESNYIPFLLCGLIVWKWFGSTIIIAANSIYSNSQIMQQVYIKKYVFSLIAVATNTAKFIVVFVMLILFLIIYGVHVELSWIFIPLVLLVQLFLIISLSLIVSALVPFIPDIRLVIENMMLLLFFISGIFFDITTVPEKMQLILKINPMAIIIESYRRILLLGETPNMVELSYVIGISLLILASGIIILNKYDKTYPKIVL